MFYPEQSDDYRPLFWVQGHPVRANTLVIAIQVVAFIVSALCISALGAAAVEQAVWLEPGYVWHGQVWRLFSYVAFDPTVFSQPFWFLINLAMLYFCGREVEQYVGRIAYLKLYAALVLVPAILLCLAAFVMPTLPYLNFGTICTGYIIAFATLYPGAMPFFIPLAMWLLAWIWIALLSLVALAAHDYTGLFMLLSSSLVGYLGIRLHGGGRGMNWLTDWFEQRRAARLAKERNFKIVREQEAAASIDAILEKISKQGVNSLNARERAALEQARANLLKRDER